MRSAERLRKYYSRLPLGEADLLLHLGWSDDECAGILREQSKPGARIVVFEPDQRRIRPRPADLADPRFRVVTGAAIDRFFDDWNLGPLKETDRILWIQAPGAGEYASLAESLKLRLKSHLRDRAANLLTHFQ